MPEKLAIGVDLGGTKILASLVNLDNGRIIVSAKKKTRTVENGLDLVKRIIATIEECMEAADIGDKKLQGIGIGAAGMVDRERGILLAAANLGANDVPLKAPIEERFGLKVTLGNDVEVATIGEQNFGAGRDCKHFVCIFVGTGIGSGLVVDGKIQRGFTGTAGEIGHIPVIPDGRPCGCGGFGCLEAYSSRTAIARNILFDLSRGFDSVLRDRIDQDKGILRSKAISQAIEAQDMVTIRSIETAAYYMGIGLSTVINFVNPQRIILGGGLIEAIPDYINRAMEEAKRRALKIPGRKTEIVRAELGDYAGSIGAALLTR
ncbi:MAG: ROK family protein [Candidatus Melainabacteria bacterium]|nr:ROK family protein [Candidatus Melainabacteria bacterium]